MDPRHATEDPNSDRLALASTQLGGSLARVVQAIRQGNDPWAGTWARNLSKVPIVLFV
ncbi:MAG: hypothetical protein HQM01_13405 [Magnetococcales bacterium]|nr:hypothetical protein [Magnetococcales bacterium]